MNERGFTFLETIVWIGMFALVMMALGTAIVYFYRTSSFTIAAASAVTSAQQGIDKMVRTMREASYASNGAYPIVAMSTSSFTFYADIDTDSGIERVRYYLVGTNLEQGIVDPSGDPPTYSGSEATTTIADNIRNLSIATDLFTFYNASGTVMTDFSLLGSLRFVSVNVGVDVDTTRPPTAIYIRSSAALRNLVGK